MKNSNIEITETGIRIKVFGIPYVATEKELDESIHLLMGLLEKVQSIRKEKEGLLKAAQERFLSG